MINDYNRQDIEQKLKDGKIQMVANKKDDGVMQIGGGKGKKGKGKKQNQNPTNVNENAFSIEFVMIGKFGNVGVSPPISADDLDPKIEELKQRMQSLEKEGT